MTSNPTGVRFPTSLFGVLVFFSGSAALIHQLLWTRRLIDLLGASTESSARVFGVFFLGLSIGSAAAAVLVRRTPNPLRVAGLAQLCIPILVVPVIYLSNLTDWIWPNIGSEITSGSSGFLLKSLITLLFILPPSVMMGLSFPLIVAGVLGLQRGQLSGSGINLYAVNTLGGAFGVAFGVLIALPQLGNFASMVLAAAIDGLVGIALLMLSMTPQTSKANPETHNVAQESPSRSHPMGHAIGLAFFSGAAVLALEVVAFQIFQLAATISLFSPAAVLFAAIVSLGLAAAFFSRFRSALMSNDRYRMMTLIMIVSGILAIAAPQLFMLIAKQSNWFASSGGVLLFVLKLGTLAVISVGPSWLAVGLIFPSVVAFAGEHCTPTQSGQRLGLLLAVNGLGGLLGAECAYRILLPVFGVYGAMTAIALAFTFAGLIVSIFREGSNSRLGNIVGASASVLLVFGIGKLNAQLPVINPPPGVTPLDIQSGREGTVAVIEDPKGEKSILVSNQYVLGGTAVRYNQERQALLPLVLHKQPSNVACIGLATGITPGAALSVGSVKKVVAVEISPLVARAAETYFDDFNHQISSSDAADIVIGDGRTVIASMATGFDVVTGDLFLPWAPGTSRLYSREHFSAVRSTLNSGGVFCQWLPMYQLTRDQFQMIANTFAHVFEETHLFLNHFSISSPMLGLIGVKERGWLNWQQIENRCSQIRKSNDILDPVLRHASGIRLLYLGQWLDDQMDTPLVTLSDPSLEYSAATVRLSDDPFGRYFNPSKWIRFCRTRQRRYVNDPSSRAGTPGSDPTMQAKLMLLSTGLLELDYAKRTQHKLTSSIAARVQQNLPKCFIEDRLADMSRWPGQPVTDPSQLDSQE